MTFKVGDRVRATDKVPEFYWWKPGAVGTVIKAEPYNYFVIKFDGSVADAVGSVHADNGYIELLPPEAPSIAKDLKLTPQAKTILRHLNARKSISPMEALITYSISRLASCIHEIRKAGYEVLTSIKQDEQGHKYANYAFPTPETVH